MQLTLDSNQGVFTIRSYEPGTIQVNDSLIHNSIIITPTEIINPWKPQSLSELSAQDFLPILKFAPEIFLLGTGEHQHFPSPLVLQELYKQQIGVEVMDTGAACRTYNVLMSESRNVVVALLIG